jgi:predicted aspartyl protease
MTDRFAYNHAYRPPIPSLQVSLGLPGHEPTLGPLSAIVDTGADATLVPLDYIKQIGAPRVDTGNLRSQWGERRPVFIYAIALQIGIHRFAAVWAVGDESSDEIVIGRNVLNQLRTLLDGPASTLELLDSQSTITNR